MKILSWNIAHRTQRRALHPDILEVFREQTPDLLALSEYVDGDGRSEFKQSLKELGYAQIYVTEPLPRHNQMLLASKSPFEVIPIDIETNLPEIKANMVLFEVGKYRLLSVRVIMGGGAELKALSFLAQVMERYQPDVVFGDLNATAAELQKTYLKNHLDADYRIIDYEGTTFLDASAIGHVIVRKPLEADLKVLKEIAGRPLVGKPGAFASDHAALAFKIRE